MSRENPQPIRIWNGFFYKIKRMKINHQFEFTNLIWIWNKGTTHTSTWESERGLINLGRGKKIHVVCGSPDRLGSSQFEIHDSGLNIDGIHSMRCSDAPAPWTASSESHTCIYIAWLRNNRVRFIQMSSISQVWLSDSSPPPASLPAISSGYHRNRRQQLMTGRPRSCQGLKESAVALTILTWWRQYGEDIPAPWLASWHLKYNDHHWCHICLQVIKGQASKWWEFLVSVHVFF